MIENSLTKHIRKINKTINWVFFALGFIMLIIGIATQTIASSGISLLVTIASAFLALFFRHKNKEDAAQLCSSCICYHTSPSFIANVGP